MKWTAPLEKKWADLVEQYAAFVCRHPWPFIIIPTLVTIGLSSGIFMDFKIIRGVRYLYSPLNAIWKQEEAVLIKNWASDDEHFYPGKDVTRRRGLYMIIQPKDGGNILRQQHSQEILQILDWIMTENFTSPSGITLSYKDVCLTFQNECFSNAQAKLVAKVFANGHQSSFNITYPTFRSQFATEPVDLSKTLGNAVTDHRGHLVAASTWLLLYQLKGASDHWNKLGANFENAVSQAIDQSEFPSELLDVFYFHSDTFEQELAKENKRITPMFSITFTVLILFSIACTYTVKWVETPARLEMMSLGRTGSKVPLIDWVLSKPWMGVVGVVSTLMAIISSTGLLLHLGVQFVDMCTVMPFLSLTIGIDDTFLMLAAWHDTDRRLGFEARIRKAMRHAAVSISITSLTDALAFMIGAIAPLPAVMYFCYYSSAAICFIFVYCITIFTAFLSLQARWEEQSRNSLFGRNTTSFDRIEKSSLAEICFNIGSQSPFELTDDSNNNNEFEKAPSANKENDVDHRMWYQKFFEDYYGPFVVRLEVTIFSFFLYLVYAFFAYVGIQQLVVGFDLIHIVQKDSLSRKFLEVRQSLFPEDMTNMDIAVLSPPDMSNTTERRRFFELLEQLETSFCSEGRDSTAFWFFAYERHLDELGFGLSFAELNQDSESFYSNLKGFLLANEKWAYDVHWSSNNKSISNFRLSTRLRNVSTDRSMYECATHIRNLCASSNYAVSTYTPLWNIADQYDIMWPQTMQDLIVSIAVMVPVSLLFIPQPLCSLAIAANIASIAFGVIGFMTFWEVNLDATSMITIAMSVGFSVDFAAHVSYAYMTEDDEGCPRTCPAEKRLCRTLGSVGWPVTQASLSVLLGVSSLSFVESFVVQTCFKTVVLVIAFGTIHALLFLPLVLFNVHKIYITFRPKSNVEKTVDIIT